MSDADSLQDHLMETLRSIKHDVELKMGIASALAELAGDEQSLLENLRGRLATVAISGQNVAAEARRLMNLVPIHEMENLVDAAKEHGRAQGAAWAVSEVAKSIAIWRRATGCDEKH